MDGSAIKIGQLETPVYHPSPVVLQVVESTNTELTWHCCCTFVSRTILLLARQRTCNSGMVARMSSTPATWQHDMVSILIMLTIMSSLSHLTPPACCQTNPELRGLSIGTVLLYCLLSPNSCWNVNYQIIALRVSNSNVYLDTLRLDRLGRWPMLLRCVIKLLLRFNVVRAKRFFSP